MFFFFYFDHNSCWVTFGETTRFSPSHALSWALAPYWSSETWLARNSEHLLSFCYFLLSNCTWKKAKKSNESNMNYKQLFAWLQMISCRNMVMSSHTRLTTKILGPPTFSSAWRRKLVNHCHLHQLIYCSSLQVDKRDYPGLSRHEA